MTNLGDAASDLAWYPAAYTLALCALTPVAGKMATVFPLDLVYNFSTVIFLVGSILCGWAPNSSAFIAGRAIAGIGAAGVASNGLTILVTIAPLVKRPKFMGLGAACYVIGLVAGPLVGGA
jgi:MFS family permease